MTDAKEATTETLDVEETLALIKPDAFHRSSEIIDRILKNGFNIIEQRQLVLTKTLASQFYAEHQGRPFFDGLVTHMTSGPIYALKLRKNNAIKDWRSLMGPTKREDALKQKTCMRALFGSSTTENATHGSDSIKSANRELAFFFDIQQTLAMIKPTAVKEGFANKIIARIENEGFIIVEKQEIVLTKERAGEFYAEHKGKAFFDGLVGHMTSGPIIALKLEGNNAIKKWRSLMGPTKKEEALKQKECLRALYAKSTTQNAVHGSDSMISASRELEFFFPKEQTFGMIKPDGVRNKHVKSIITRIVKEGFIIRDSKLERLTQDKAKEFYGEHKERSFFGELIEYITSGPVLLMKLEGNNAVKRWRSVMGPTFVDVAKKENPNSIRALYGHSKTENAVHGSDSISSSKRELSYMFNKGGKLQRTLAIIKPDAVRKGSENEIINVIKYSGFSIINMKKLKLTQDLAAGFYAEHKGKTFYDKLIDFMTSGECVVLELERINAIESWRNIMGPTKREHALQQKPNSIRALFGSNNTQNATHGSDSIKSAERELKYFFG